MITVAPDSAPASNKEAAEKVLKYARHYSRLFGLDDWRIFFYWGLASDFEDPEDAIEYAAETRVDTEYNKARIFFNLDRPTLDQIEEDVRHEFLHIITWTFVGIIETLTFSRAKAAVEKLEESFITRLEGLPLWKELPKLE